jgi:hypothetical protein
VSISPKGFVFFAAAVFTIISTIIGVVYFLGVWTSLKFDWMASAIPYLKAFLVCAVLLWLLALVMDYVAVRRAAFATPENNSTAPPDFTPVTQMIQVEEKKRADAIEAVFKELWNQVGKINQSINDLRPKPEPPLKQRTTQLANELFTLLNQQGPKPRNPLTVHDTEHNAAFNAYFDWTKELYYKYMAYYKDRVVKIDFELAANGHFTKLEDRELHPKGEVDVKKIAEALLLTANQLTN